MNLNKLSFKIKRILQMRKWFKSIKILKVMMKFQMLAKIINKRKKHNQLKIINIMLGIKTKILELVKNGHLKIHVLSVMVLIILRIINVFLVIQKIHNIVSVLLRLVNHVRRIRLEFYMSNKEKFRVKQIHVIKDTMQFQV